MFPLRSTVIDCGSKAVADILENSGKFSEILNFQKIYNPTCHYFHTPSFVTFQLFSSDCSSCSLVGCCASLGILIVLV